MAYIKDNFRIIGKHHWLLGVAQSLNLCTESLLQRPSSGTIPQNISKLMGCSFARLFRSVWESDKKMYIQCRRYIKRSINLLVITFIQKKNP